MTSAGKSFHGLTTRTLKKLIVYVQGCKGVKERRCNLYSLCIMNNKILQERQGQTLPLSGLAAWHALSKILKEKI